MMSRTRTAAAAPVAAAVVAPPVLKGGATEAFRVADVRTGAREFLATMAELLCNAPLEAGSGLDASDLRLPTEEEAVEAALAAQRDAAATAPTPLDSRPQESDGAAERVGAAPASAPAAGPSSADGTRRRRKRGRAAAAPAAAPEGTQEDEAQSSDMQEAEEAEEEEDGEGQATDSETAAAQNQAVKLAAQQASAGVVAAVRRRRQAEWDEAAQTLRSLQEVRTDGDDGEAAPSLRWRRKKALAGFGLAAHADPASTAEGRARQLQQVAQAGQHAAQAAQASASPAVPEGEVVLHVAVHFPQAPAHVSEEWLVLGSQRLTELRDVVYCLSEANAKRVEADENARRARAGQPLVQLFKPSAYFYVEGTFYNDMRRPDAVDYSEGIRQYNREHGVRAPPHPAPAPASAAPRGALLTDFSCASMEDSRFEDLWLRLGAGAPGLYCHQGGCEHLLVFRDVRLHDAQADPLRVGQYPFKLSTAATGGMVNYRLCEACGTRTARCVTYGDSSTPHTPYFWCDECFKSLHYDPEGRALYTDYAVFPYTHDYHSMLLHGAGRKQWD